MLINYPVINIESNSVLEKLMSGLAKPLADSSEKHSAYSIPPLTAYRGLATAPCIYARTQINTYTRVATASSRVNSRYYYLPRCDGAGDRWRLTLVSTPPVHVGKGPGTNKV